jgi:hypothetical protein
MATLQLLNEKIKTLKQKLNQDPKASLEEKGEIRSLRKHIKRLQRRRRVLQALEARAMNLPKKKVESEKTSQVKAEMKEETEEKAKEKIKRETKEETEAETKAETKEEAKEKAKEKIKKDTKGETKAENKKETQSDL